MLAAVEKCSPTLLPLVAWGGVWHAQLPAGAVIAGSGELAEWAREEGQITEQITLLLHHGGLDLPRTSYTGASTVYLTVAGATQIVMVADPEAFRPFACLLSCTCCPASAWLDTLPLLHSLKLKSREVQTSLRHRLDFSCAAPEYPHRAVWLRGCPVSLGVSTVSGTVPDSSAIHADTGKSSWSFPRAYPLRTSLWCIPSLSKPFLGRQQQPDQMRQP
jgi:hypothetical protein